jgi:hypothetical protein
MDTTTLTARVDQLAAWLRDTRHCDVLDPCDSCEDKRAELASLRARIAVAKVAS